MGRPILSLFWNLCSIHLKLIIANFRLVTTLGTGGG